jgi:dihydroorotase
MVKTLIKNALIINDGKSYKASVLLEGEFIKQISDDDNIPEENCQIIDAEGKWLIPGVIDDQVHFREPGLTHKAEIYTESKAALAGGVTSFMEMPNTIPQTTNIEELKKKFNLAAEKSFANYSFYLGATNDNIKEIIKVDPKTTCGVKVFMGSSTGNMLVDKKDSLAAIFSESPVLIATHCEDENIIQRNMELYRHKYGENLSFKYHPEIRSEEACYASSSFAVELANKYNSRLHVLHISTAKELELFRNDIPARDKKITSEVCVHHLWFNDGDYSKKGSLIKWNPAVKKESDRLALLKGVLINKLDVIATDHAPHTLDEKSNSYFKAPSGGPMVQHSLTAMIEMTKKGHISLEKVVEKMCHLPADIYQIEKRGYIKEGFYADLVLVNPDESWTVSQDNLHYKCGWSPMEGVQFSTKVVMTILNGKIVYENGHVKEERSALPLSFNR